MDQLNELNEVANLQAENDQLWSIVRENESLRAENERLQRESDRRLADLSDIANLRDQLYTEVERLKAENRSLAQKRVDMAEIERLRAEKIEWSDVATQERQENGRLRAALESIEVELRQPRCECGLDVPCFDHRPRTLVWVQMTRAVAMRALDRHD